MPLFDPIEKMVLGINGVDVVLRIDSSCHLAMELQESGYPGEALHVMDSMLDSIGLMDLSDKIRPMSDIMALPLYATLVDDLMRVGNASLMTQFLVSIAAIESIRVVLR